MSDDRWLEEQNQRALESRDHAIEQGPPETPEEDQDPEEEEDEPNEKGGNL